MDIMESLRANRTMLGIFETLDLHKMYELADQGFEIILGNGHVIKISEKEKCPAGGCRTNG